jgi:hypothetical protein
LYNRAEIACVVSKSLSQPDYPVLVHVKQYHFGACCTDIRGFFDNLDKSWLIKFVEHRVADPRILRLIQKWLNAGVMEEGKWSDTKTGSPQGSVITPPYTKGNFQFERVITGWLTRFPLLDLRRNR